MFQLVSNTTLLCRRQFTQDWCVWQGVQNSGGQRVWSYFRKRCFHALRQGCCSGEVRYRWITACSSILYSSVYLYCNMPVISTYSWPCTVNWRSTWVRRRADLIQCVCCMFFANSGFLLRLRRSSTERTCARQIFQRSLRVHGRALGLLYFQHSNEKSKPVQYCTVLIVLSCTGIKIAYCIHFSFSRNTLALFSAINMEQLQHEGMTIIISSCTLIGKFTVQYCTNFGGKNLPGPETFKKKNIVL